MTRVVKAIDSVSGIPATSAKSAGNTHVERCIDHVLVVGVLDPLPDVSRHIENAEPSGVERPDRRGAFKGVPALAAEHVGPLPMAPIPPRKTISHLDTARHPLPLGGGGQTAARPPTSQGADPDWCGVTRSAFPHPCAAAEL